MVLSSPPSSFLFLFLSLFCSMGKVTARTKGIEKQWEELFYNDNAVNSNGTAGNSSKLKFLALGISADQTQHLIYRLNGCCVCCSVLQCVAVGCSVLQCVAVCCSVLQCVAVCCSVLQCGAACCSVLQCVAVCWVMSHEISHKNESYHTGTSHVTYESCRI